MDEGTRRREGGSGSACAQESAGAPEGAKSRCPDCFQCQGCSEDRCRVCRKQGHSEAPTLPTGFTFGEYTAWKEARDEKVGGGSRS